MVKYIGCYNIDNVGEIWDKLTCYSMVIFSRFNQQDEEVERKIIYFLRKNNFNSYPDFKTEEEITRFLKNKKNYQKIAL